MRIRAGVGPGAARALGPAPVHLLAPDGEVRASQQGAILTQAAASYLVAPDVGAKDVVSGATEHVVIAR